MIRAFLLIIACTVSWFILLYPERARCMNTAYNEKQRENIIATAKKYLGVRYNFGGTKASGFDCSGFVGFVYKENGIILPRTTRAQFNKGAKISLESARAGDLVFFKISPERISHVGIYLGDLKFIHAPSSGKEVSISSIDSSYWRERFVGAVTYFK